MWASINADVLARLPREGGDGRTDGGWDDAFADLNRYREYGEDDWDGQRATGIRGELIDSAAALAGRLRQLGVAPPDCTLPSVLGTVGFEWDRADGGSVTLEVTEAGNAGLTFFRPGRPAERFVLTETVAA